MRRKSVVFTGVGVILLILAGLSVMFFEPLKWVFGVAGTVMVILGEIWPD